MGLQLELSPQISIPDVRQYHLKQPTGCVKIPTSLKFSSTWRCSISSRPIEGEVPEKSSSDLLPLSRNGMSVMSRYNDMIRGYVDDGLFENAVEVYVEMLQCGVPVAEFGYFPSLIKAVGELEDFRMATQIHGQVLKLGAMNDVSVANSTMGMYWKCGAAYQALCMFESMVERDSVSFSTMLSGACHCRDFVGSLLMFKKMVGEFGVYPNRVACLSVLSACGSIPSLIHGREIHGYAIKTGMACHQFLVSRLADMYMKCGHVRNAQNVFHGIFEDDAMLGNPVIWNAMIFGYVENDCLEEASELINKMLDFGVRKDSSTLVAALGLASHFTDSSLGEQVHGQAYKLGLEDEIRVVSALADAYFKSGNAGAAERLFGVVENHSLVLWGIMVSNYVESGFPTKSLELCHRFMIEYAVADPVILLAAFRACSSLTILSKGKEFHAIVVKQGVRCDVYVGGAIIDLYAKCGDVQSAKAVFHHLSTRDVVSWNALISALSQNDLMGESLRALHDMQSENIAPNSVTLAATLSVSAQLSAMMLVKEIHGYILRHGFKSNILVSNSLVSAYAKCGDIGSARVIFNRICRKDVISWNSVILGFGMHGIVDEMFLLFESMKSSSVHPDHATFTALLSACSHTGRLNVGLEYFKTMTGEYKLEPRLEQYTCMVDLLGRAGLLGQAYELIIKMPFPPDERIWGSLLASCKTHGDERLAETVAEQIFQLDSDNVGYRVLLSNLHRSEGRWDNVEAIWSDIRDRGLKKDPGCSRIVVNNSTHGFTAGDCLHLQSEEIYATLDSLTAEIMYTTCFMVHSSKKFFHG